MKKTLAVAAVLAAFAGSAMADVTVYGKVDMGMVWNHGEGSDVVKMASGQSSGSRYGLKGSEKIADGLTVGFQLEAGIAADTGANAGTATFHRESRIYVATDYGTFHFGRMGTLDAGTGSVDLFGGMSAYGTGWGADDVIGAANFVAVKDTRRDNVFTYQSPKMAGVTAYAQVASKSAADGSEFTHKAERYYGVGAKYQAGAFNAAFVATQLDAADHADERNNFNAGVGYDFGVAKVMLQANYMEQGDAENKAVVLSATAPVATGKVLAMVGYGVATDAEDVDTDKLNVAVSYQHTLSKQTYLYAGLGYNESEEDGGEKKDATIGMFGICHNF